MDQQAFAQFRGNYGEFIGAIAVVVTLVYLSSQIRQSTQMLRRQAHYDRNSALTEPFLEPGSPLPSTYAKIHAGDGSIEPVTTAFMQHYGLDTNESVVWLRYLHRIFFGWEADFLFVGRSRELDLLIANILRFPNGQLFWKHEKIWLFTPQFVEYVDSLSHQDLPPAPPMMQRS